jgi:hypothetical protein
MSSAGRTTATRVVLAPHVGFADVADAMAGWTGGATDLAPWLAGEPVSARWRRNEAEVSYSANPALGLRVLEGSGLREVAQLPAAMTVDQASWLAGSADPAEAALGVTALGLLGDAAALPDLERTASHRATEPAVAGAATLAVRRIGLAALVTGADRIAERRAERPEQDPVLGLLRPVSVRRQVLRAFLADPPDDRTRVLEVVRAGLADDDWEVRWTAVLGAHDRHLSELLLPIRRCPMGPDRGQRPVLEALRDVVGHRLAGTRSTIPGADRIEALLDDDSVEYDAAFLLVRALRHPLPDPPDDRAPAGFTRVPAVPHWLGHAETGVRRVAPGSSFAIATSPVLDVRCERVDAVLRDQETTGRRLRLPTPDELEMATRGPDGRRFPWGNAREPGWRRAVSPWGLAGPIQTTEWVAVDGVMLAVPSAHGGCGLRPVPAERAAVRGVIDE